MRLNLEKINPIKRAKIEKGIDLIEKCNAKEKVVDKMIIFGSATGDALCWPVEFHGEDEILRKYSMFGLIVIML